jgi:hypothetical protein
MRRSTVLVMGTSALVNLAKSTGATESSHLVTILERVAQQQPPNMVRLVIPRAAWEKLDSQKTLDDGALKVLQELR